MVFDPERILFMVKQHVECGDKEIDLSEETYFSGGKLIRVCVNVGTITVTFQYDSGDSNAVDGVGVLISDLTSYLASI